MLTEFMPKTNDKQIIKANGLAFIPFISEKEIKRQVQIIGEALTEKYKGKNPLFLGILNGSFMFTADLLRACDMECEIAFVKLSSYEGLQSSGKVATVIGVAPEIVKGREIIIIEDIVDTGKTMSHFMQTLQTFEPKSVALVTLLLKPDALQHDIKIDYIAFSIPNKFVIGYGLDYDGVARNLKEIYQLAE